MCSPPLILLTLEAGASKLPGGQRDVAAAYSQTTYPDLFKTYVQRDLKLGIQEMRDLSGQFCLGKSGKNFRFTLLHPISVTCRDKQSTR